MRYVHSFTLNIRLCSPHHRCIQRQCWIDLDQCLEQVCSNNYFVKQFFFLFSLSYFLNASAFSIYCSVEGTKVGTGLSEFSSLHLWKAVFLINPNQKRSLNLFDALRIFKMQQNACYAKNAWSKSYCVSGAFSVFSLLTYKPGNCAHCKHASNVLYCFRGSDWAQKQKQAWHDNLRGGGWATCIFNIFVGHNRRVNWHDEQCQCPDCSK